MRITVAGGTGTVGTHVVGAARAAGHDVDVLSRRDGIDLTSAQGLERRLQGTDAVIDVTDPSTLSARTSVTFFRAVTSVLLEAEQAAGVPHHVALSIVGAEAVDAGYYAGKAAQERLVRASGSSWSILRATQFYEFAAQTVSRGSFAGLLLAPKMRTQPVAAADVAAELVRIAADGPSGLVPDLAGPREESLPDLVRRFVAATHQRGRVVTLPLPGAFGRSLRDGSLLPHTGAHLTTSTFDEWLTEL